MWYRIFNSANPKEIGIVPQVYNGIIPTTINDPNYIGNWLLKKAPKDVYLPKGILAAKAKLTDLISVSYVGFSPNLYVSSKLKDILKSSYYFGVQYFHAPLIIQPTHEELDYWLIHTYDFGYSCLDLQHSQFYITFASDDKQVEIQFKNEKELFAKLNSLKPNDNMHIEKVVLREDIPNDFLALKAVIPGGIGYYVSEKLWMQIQAAGCSGIVFKEINEVYP